jgi:LPXTG-motif cell wall-anchored protein
MVIVECSQDPAAYCDIVCAQPTPAAAVPATSITGTLIGMAILVGLGAYTLRRRGQRAR